MSVKSDAARKATYGDLVGGQLFNLPFTGTAPAKSPAEYKLVGTRFPRNDTPDKVSGDYVYLQHLRPEGILHARVVRPRGQRAYGAGAKVLNIDEAPFATSPARASCAGAISSALSPSTSGTPSAPRNN